MEFSYIKLNAKKRLVKNHFKCFLVSVFPYVTIFLLTVLNYYLYIFLKGADFGFNPYISSYALYIKASLYTLSLIISFFLWKISQLVSEKFFFSRNIKNKNRLTFRKYITAITVSALKFFLSVAWSAVFYSPCAVMTVTLYYCINSGDYTFNVMVTLFVASVLLMFIGSGFLYITLKRYSMCNYVILSGTETDSLKVIEKSIKIMEGNTVKYTFYSLSFSGWILSCILIVPIIYVLPYVKMAKYSFLKAVIKPVTKEQKPVIFYLTKKIITWSVNVFCC